MQHTLKTSVTFDGVGLHSGCDVTMTVHPAEAGHGIVFVRTDVTDSRAQAIAARWDAVVDTKLCTVIGNEDGVTLGTIEHLMAALRGCAIDNALIEINGPEVPVMDGSSVAFVEKFDETGFVRQDAPRRAIRVLKEVEVTVEGKKVALKPADIATFSGFIDFDHPLIGNQKYEIKLLNGNFRHDLADARTFGFAHEVEALRKMGLALGGSLDNAIVLDSEKVLNAQGLRYSDEFIRHKLLDAIGDLYLAGGPLLAAYEGEKSSHDLNNKLLHALFADDSAWEFVDAPADQVQAS
ncbi:MAG: UDP-3-O-acyl-N-acetylglucosamine deacetylase [Alphaproteobacteria bacterium]|jgi:UDP-3-O-[3-hydroxymyristoyl] N-acetylglucosamine deacetylase|nr:UDP-3-O-acyl-N-acetylglucosamine deacetylase [Alphaproteobacteria bacterium]MDP7223203.1 UDP-3-O-acyl-N-acetylglucosamine deacetylase [Alphaproteobacteria bacterium]